MSYYSETEYHLRTLVDRVTAGLVQETPVSVIPGSKWESDPLAQPPVLRYRIADVAVLGDALLHVAATEIGHVLFTRAADWTFRIDANPEAAQLLFDEVERARIQRRMSQLYAGTHEVFARFDGEQPPTGAWSSSQTRKDFMNLPVKWRYILNVNRTLRGMSMLGNGFELEYLREVADDLESAVSASSTQSMVPHLERPFIRLADAIARESEDRIKEENKSKSDFQHPQAQVDDGKPGGEDGSPGMREDGKGLDGPDSNGSESSGSPQGGDGGEQRDPDDRSLEEADEHSSDVPETSPEESSDSEGGTGQRPPSEPGESDAGSDPPEEVKVKTNNVFRAMVEDLKEGEGGKAVQNFRNYFKKVDREANRIEQKIDQEGQDNLARMAEGLGNPSGRKTERVMAMVEEGDEIIRTILPELDPFIRALRKHVRSVLRENDVDTFGGSYRTGRRVKRNKLYRIETENEPRLFERKVVMGGKSYCIGIASDQSSSMRRDDRIVLAGICTVSALEAFDGLIETATTGFFTATTPFGSVDKVYHYKRIDEPVSYVRPILGQLFTCRGSTPLGAGLAGVLDEVKRSTAEVRTIILVSDGQPSGHSNHKQVFEEAARQKVPVDALAIGGGRPFHSQFCRHVVEIFDPTEIVPGYVSLLRRIIHRTSAAA